VEREKFELHSFMMLRHGQVIAEGWWEPYGPELVHTMYSMSKSFTSTAVGFAVAEGKMSVEDKVVSFFPDDLPSEDQRQSRGDAREGSAHHGHRQ
jgi:CubicO group peptidase (beta-lactamase class C family)